MIRLETSSRIWTGHWYIYPTVWLSMVHGASHGRCSIGLLAEMSHEFLPGAADHKHDDGQYAEDDSQDHGDDHDPRQGLLLSHCVLHF